MGAMVVPQGMSYAKLAGLPNVYGLYGAFVPVMIYAALGSSPQLVSYPSAQAHSCIPLVESGCTLVPSSLAAT